MKYFITIITAALISANVAYAFEPWTQDNKVQFSNMLFEAGKSDGNWTGHLNDVGLRLMTDCITSYYAESISFEKALEYYDTMPQDVAREFNFVLGQCYNVAKNQENNFI